jgi:hypothetical protein
VGQERLLGESFYEGQGADSIRIPVDPGARHLTSKSNYRSRNMASK